MRLTREQMNDLEVEVRKLNTAQLEIICKAANKELARRPPTKTAVKKLTSDKE